MERYLLINSAQRVSGTSSSFKIPLDKPLSNIRKVELVSASFYNTIYNIRTGINDKVVFNDGTQYTATIAAGNYVITDLIVALQTALNATASALVFTVTYSDITLKVTIAAGSAFTILFGSSGVMYRELGFTAATTGSATSQTGTNVVNLSLPHYLFINVLEFGEDYITCGGGSDCPTFVVMINSGRDDLIDFSEQTHHKNVLHIGHNLKNITRLTIRLSMANTARDTPAEPVDLNGSEFAMILRLIE